MEDASFQVSEMVVDHEEETRLAILKAEEELWLKDHINWMIAEEKSDMEKWWERGIPKMSKKPEDFDY